MMDTLLQLEINLTLFLQSLGGWLNYPMQLFSFFGTQYFYILILPAIYWCIDSAIGIRIAVMLVFSVSTNSYIKLLFHTPRPYWVDSRVKAFSSETSFGLPSGHSQNAVSLWGTLALEFKKRWLTIVCVCLIILIGLSRIYLGVHFLHDVLGGWLAGGILLLLLWKLDKPVTRWITSRTFSSQILIVFAISVVLVLLGELTAWISRQTPIPQSWINQALASTGVAPDPYSLTGVYSIAGVFLGFGSGLAWLIHRYAGYKVEGNIRQKIVRLIVGLISTGLIYILVKLVIPADPAWLANIVTFIGYALIGAWVAAGAPVLFKRLELDK